MRILVIALVTLILIVGSFILIAYARDAQQQLSKFSPVISCPTTAVTKDEAYADQI